MKTNIIIIIITGTILTSYLYGAYSYTAIDDVPPAASVLDDSEKTAINGYVYSLDCVLEGTIGFLETNDKGTSETDDDSTITTEAIASATVHLEHEHSGPKTTSIRSVELKPGGRYTREGQSPVDFSLTNPWKRDITLTTESAQ